MGSLLILDNLQRCCWIKEFQDNIAPRSVQGGPEMSIPGNMEERRYLNTLVPRL
jgi:hypothetical protein